MNFQLSSFQSLVWISFTTLLLFESIIITVNNIIIENIIITVNIIIIESIIIIVNIIIIIVIKSIIIIVDTQPYARLRPFAKSL